MTVILLLCLLLASILFIDGVQYCAKFPGENDNVLGYFAMKVNHGIATYSFSLDLSSFADSTTCDLTNGLYYHLHTSWNTDTGRNSGLGSTDCGSTVTGGHYDPNLACSASSESASGDCTLLSRTSTLGYTYNCSTSVYNAGMYAQCEVGDLSGKFGIVYPTTNYRFVQPFAAHTDYQPPYVYNYLKSDNVATMFSSIVFHCVDSSKTRLVCGLLEEMEDDGVCGHPETSLTGSLKLPPPMKTTNNKVGTKNDESLKMKQTSLTKGQTTESNQKVFKSSRFADSTIKTANAPTKSPSSGVHKPTWRPSFKPAESKHTARSLIRDPPPGSKGALTPPVMAASRPETVVDVKHGGIDVDADALAEIEAAAAAKVAEEEAAAAAAEQAAAEAAEAARIKEEEEKAAEEAAEKEAEEEKEREEKEKEEAEAEAAAEAEKEAEKAEKKLEKEEKKREKEEAEAAAAAAAAAAAEEEEEDEEKGKNHNSDASGKHQKDHSTKPSKSPTKSKSKSSRVLSSNRQTQTDVKKGRKNRQ